MVFHPQLHSVGHRVSYNTLSLCRGQLSITSANFPTSLSLQDVWLAWQWRHGCVVTLTEPVISPKHSAFILKGCEFLKNAFFQNLSCIQQGNGKKQMSSVSV
jgi:hypothetical protein